MTYQHSKPRRIEIGSDYVTVPPVSTYGIKQIARILRRECDDTGAPVHLVLDRLIADASYSTTFVCGDEQWTATGCVATELRRVSGSHP